MIVTGAVQSMDQALPEGASLTYLGKHFLCDLNEPAKLYQLDDARLPVHEFPPLETLNNYSHNLLLVIDSFIGREQMLEEFAHLLSGNGGSYASLLPAPQ